MIEDHERASESTSSSRSLSGSSETACDPAIKKHKLSSCFKKTIELQLSSVSTPQNPDQKMKKESQGELDPLHT